MVELGLAPAPTTAGLASNAGIIKEIQVKIMWPFSIYSFNIYCGFFTVRSRLARLVARGLENGVPRRVTCHLVQSVPDRRSVGLVDPPPKEG